MASTFFLDGPAFNIQGLNDLSGDAFNSVRPRNVSQALLPDGRVALSWLDDIRSGTDRAFVGVLDPETGAVSRTQVATQFSHISAGTGSTLLAIENSGLSPKLHKLALDGTTIGTPTNLFAGIAQAMQIKAVHSYADGGFGVITGGNGGSLEQFSLLIFDRTGTRTATLLNTTPAVNNIDSSGVASVKLTNGNIVMVWSTSGTSGGGMDFQIFTPTGVAVGGRQSVATGSAGSTFFNVWRAGSVELAALPDGGFAIARGVDFQTFSATGAVTSARAMAPGTRITDIEASGENGLLVFSDGTNVNGHVAELFERSGTAPDSRLTEATSFTFKPDATSTQGGMVSFNPIGNPVVALGDGTFLVLTAAGFGDPGNRAQPYDSALLAQRLSLSSSSASGVPTAGSDILTGTAGRDAIDGLGGDDVINGLGGNDRLFGGPGIDTIYGGDGDDYIQGDAGASSVLSGDAGNDTIYGGAGNDYMIGGAGNDILVGLGGQDSLYGGAGDDYIVAGDGPGSVLDGGEGANSLWGASGNDYAVGGSGADIIVTAAGSDYLFGNAGDDSIYAGAGTDYIFGNAGNDFIYTDDVGASFTDYVYAGGGTGIDTIVDFTPGAGGDVLVISASATGLSSFAQVQAATSQVGVYTVVTLGADQVYLYNVQPFQLTADNVILL